MPAVVWMLRVPERWPVAEGLKRTLRKQVAEGLRVPVQVGPPVASVARMKSPVRVGAETVMGRLAGVRLGRLTRVRAEVLETGMSPKSGLTGVRTRPVRGVPVPKSERVSGLPAAAEESSMVAVRGSVVVGLNSTPSQQSVQGLVTVLVKAERRGWPWP